MIYFKWGIQVQKRLDNFSLATCDICRWVLIKRRGMSEVLWVYSVVAFVFKWHLMCLCPCGAQFVHLLPRVCIKQRQRCACDSHSWPNNTELHANTCSMHSALKRIKAWIQAQQFKKSHKTYFQSYGLRLKLNHFGVVGRAQFKKFQPPIRRLSSGDSASSAATEFPWGKYCQETSGHFYNHFSWCFF